MIYKYSLRIDTTNVGVTKRYYKQQLLLFCTFRILFKLLSMNPILGIIPARYASSRFPGKPLIDILGKSMIQRVYEQAQKSALLTDVVVATDDDRIFNHVESFGGKAVYTKEEHPSGTDRCYEAFQKLMKITIMLSIFREMNHSLILLK